MNRQRSPRNEITGKKRKNESMPIFDIRNSEHIIDADIIKIRQFDQNLCEDVIFTSLIFGITCLYDTPFLQKCVQRYSIQNMDRFDILVLRIID